MNAFVIKHKSILYLMIVLGIAWVFWIVMAIDCLNIIYFGIAILVGLLIGTFAPLINISACSSIIITFAFLHYGAENWFILVLLFICVLILRGIKSSIKEANAEKERSRYKDYWFSINF